jgi:GntR family transcriptional regulator
MSQASLGLHVDPKDSTPIWRQIEDGVRRLVASGALAPGELVASVRELAKELRVNPATVAKAYQRLAESGVLMMKRWEGTYVADAPPMFDKEERKQMLREAAMRYAVTAATAGAKSDEAVKEFRAAVARRLLRGGAVRYEMSMTSMRRKRSSERGTEKWKE